LETTAATVAVNVVLLTPAPMFKLPGTVTLVLLLDNATLRAPGAAAVRVTVQEEFPGPVTAAGEQLKPLS
jgi:hypothetical protein